MPAMKQVSTISGMLTLAVALMWLSAAPVQAQNISATAPAAASTPTFAANPFAPKKIINYRESMRAFVQSIGTYARSIKPNFIVIAQGGLALASKVNPDDDTQFFPARTYAQSLDGILEPNLLDETVTTPDGKPDPIRAAALKRRNANVKTARDLGLDIFDLEFAAKPSQIAKLYERAERKKYIPFVAKNTDLAALPGYPSRPLRANPKSIDSLSAVRNYLYIANSQPFGSANDFIQALRNTNYDLVIVNVFHRRAALTRQLIDQLKYKKLGARRLVLAEMDITSAASFHYYWQSDWQVGSPAFIVTPYRADPDRYRTKYWDPGWQAVISGDINSYVYGIIDLGFDGVVLKDLNAWRYFENGGEEP